MRSHGDPRSGATAGRLSLLLPAVILSLLLAPLLFLGDLREAFVPYAILTVAAGAFLYLLAYRYESRGIELSAGGIVAVALLLRLTVLPLSPSLSDDAYRYLWDGRLVLHGESPYARVPADTAYARFHDDLFAVQGYPATNTIYPPGAALFFAGCAAVGEIISESYIAGYYVYKILLIGMETAAILLLLRILSALGVSRTRAVLYAWHPLPVVELAGQGHTDALWVLGIGLALYPFIIGSVEGRDRGASLAGLSLGGALRVFPLVLLPLWARFLRRHEIVAGLLLSVPALLLFTPFLDGAAWRNYTEVMMRFTNYYEFNGGVYYAVKGLLDELKVQPSNSIAGTVTTTLQFAIFLLVSLWSPGNGTPEEKVGLLIRRAMLLLTVQIVLPAKVHVWYFVAPLYLVPMLTRSASSRAWLWTALIAPVTYIAYTGSEVHEPAVVLLLEWGGFGLALLSGLLLNGTSPKRLLRARSEE